MAKFLESSPVSVQSPVLQSSYKRNGLRPVPAGKTRSIAKVPKTPRSDRSAPVTLCRDIAGQILGNRRADSHLSQQEEGSLLQEIIDNAQQGHAMAPHQIKESVEAKLKTKAELARKKGIQHKLPTTIGHNWVSKFLKHYSDIVKSSWAAPMDHSRLTALSAEVLTEWMTRVETTISELDIQRENMWNFDETNFIVGVLGKTRVVIERGHKEQGIAQQTGQRQSHTVIETISAAGKVLPPFIVITSAQIQTAWVEIMEKNGFTRDSLACNPSGYSNNQLCLHWLQVIFEPLSRPENPEQWRLLVMDGSATHLSDTISSFLKKHRIAKLVMPPQSTHKLQPLDVACFAPLKYAYKALAREQVSLGIYSMLSDDFISLFLEAHHTAMTEKNILSGFRKTGLHPFNEDAVAPDNVFDGEYSMASVVLPSDPCTPVSTIRPGENCVEFIARRHNERALRKQPNEELFSSPTKSILNDLEWGTGQINRYKNEHGRLRAENEALRLVVDTLTHRRNKKRTRQPFVLSTDPSVSTNETATIEHVLRVPVIGNDAQFDSGSGQVKVIRQRKCANCRQYGHKRTTCKQAPIG
jgi:hypothetical protein